MSYGWWKFIHLVGVVGFVAAHGTSMAATVLMRRIDEPRAGVRDPPAERGHGERVLCLDPGAPGRRVRGGIQGQWFDQGVDLVVAGSAGRGWDTDVPYGREHFRRIRMVLELMETGNHGLP